MAKSQSLENYQHEAPKSLHLNAYNYYLDYYSEEEENTFRITKDSWQDIGRSNDLAQKLTETELKLISLVSILIERSGFAHFSLEYLCAKLNITDRQLRTVRKNIDHIFFSRWRKATKISGVLKKNVYVFSYTASGRELLGNLVKNYKSIKLGSGLPTSIYKNENIKKYRSDESKSYENSNLDQDANNNPRENIPLSSTSVVNIGEVGNKTNGEERGFRNSQKSSPPSKDLKQMITTLDQSTCDEIRSKSERPDFTDHFIKQTVLKLARKTTIKASFYSIKGFIAYMSKVMRYELHDGVKCSSEHFKFKVNIDEERLEHEKSQEIQKGNTISFTTYQQRENYLNQVEDNAIRHRSDENQYKARIAGKMPPNLAYNLLMNLITIREENNILKLIMIKHIELTAHYKQILIDLAIGVGGYSEVKKLEICI